MKPQQKSALRLENVGRAFGDTVAVGEISLEISAGEIVSLVGHSGCGKSTLLRIIAGVDASDTGRVVLDDRVVDGAGFIEPERRNVGFLFQDYALFPHLSVQDNVLFGLKGRPRREAMATVSDVIGHVGIGHLADRFPHTLSGGEQQRVALARALAPGPSLILLDEPFSNLDQGLRERVRKETLGVLRAAGTTVIMVTHDPAEALSSGDRVVLMRAGRIVQSGTPREIYGRPASAYAAEFFDTFNTLPGICRDGLFETAIGRFSLPAAARRDGVTMLYVRPHAIRVSADVGEHAAHVVDRVFLGSSEKLSLRVADLDTTLTAIVTDPPPGDVDKVRFTILPDLLLAF